MLEGRLDTVRRVAAQIAEIALEIGGPGSGLAGIAAAHALGLTTQMPSTTWVAVPGPVPTAVPGLRFTERPIRRLIRSMTPWEFAVLEVLRAGPAAMAHGWDELASRTAELARANRVRVSELSAAVAKEPHRLARLHWDHVTAAGRELAELP